MQLKHEIVDLIDNGQISTENPIVPCNQHFKFFNNNFTNNNVNQVDASISFGQVYHKQGSSSSSFMGFLHVDEQQPIRGV